MRGRVTWLIALLMGKLMDDKPKIIVLFSHFCNVKNESLKLGYYIPYESVCQCHRYSQHGKSERNQTKQANDLDGCNTSVWLKLNRYGQSGWKCFNLQEFREYFNFFVVGILENLFWFYPAQKLHRSHNNNTFLPVGTITSISFHPTYDMVCYAIHHKIFLWFWEQDVKQSLNADKKLKIK